MKRVLLVAIATLVAGLAPLGTPSAQAARAVRYLDPVFSSVRVDTDLVYGRVKHDDGTVEPLKLDLYRPAGDRRGNRPVLIFVHGGSSSVDKGLKRNTVLPRAFAARGYVAASINYRKSTSGLGRDAQHDTRAAVRWFKANARRYGVAPHRIVLMGSSSGAVDVLNVAFNPEDAGSSGNPGYSSTVAAAISVSGVATEPHEIRTDEAPVAMIHADDDTTIPVAAAQATCAQTTGLGNVCEFFEYPEGGHPPGFIARHRRAIIEDSTQFVYRTVLH